MELTELIKQELKRHEFDQARYDEIVKDIYDEMLNELPRTTKVILNYLDYNKEILQKGWIVQIKEIVFQVVESSPGGVTIQNIAKPLSVDPEDRRLISSESYIKVLSRGETE